MAAPCEEASTSQLRSPAGTPGKVRDLISEGIASVEQGCDSGKEISAPTEEDNGCDAPTDSSTSKATTKDAFFSRVESFSSLKWAGMPPELSPLICAKYGWSNIECDMLKCSSCSAYLCARLQPALDFNKYKQRCVELQDALRNAHEKFCFWPDSPCPEHYWALLVTETSSVLSNFIDRFQSLCHLDMQLPSFKYEDLKCMDITENTVSLLLHLIEDELKPKEGVENMGRSMASDSLLVHVSACILALCGWTSSPSSGSLPLSIISCSRCMRKIGLWGFQQLEAIDLDTSLGPPGTPISPTEGPVDRVPLGIVSPNRRVTRSRETEQSPSSSTRTRSYDFCSPGESDIVRSRPVTRSMGHGDSTELSSSPHRRAKRPRLCSSSSSSDASPRCSFDPLAQHRSWCPWVNVCQSARSKVVDKGATESTAQSGWKEVLLVLLAENKSRIPSDLDSSSVPEKSRKVFRIFRQWQASNSS